MGSEEEQQQDKNDNIFSQLKENTETRLDLNGFKSTTCVTENDSIFFKGKKDITAGWTHSGNDSTFTMQGSVGKNVSLKTQFDQEFSNGKVSFGAALGKKNTSVTATYSKNKFTAQLGYDKDGKKYGNVFTRFTWNL